MPFLRVSFKSAVIASAALVSLLYSLPQLRHSLQGGSGALFLFCDETSYAARLNRVITGHPSVGNPWTLENRDEPAPIPPLSEVVVGGLPAVIARTGIDMKADAVVIAARAIVPVFSLLVFCALLCALGVGRWVALFVAFWIMTEPGLISYKPFGGFLGHATLPLGRFINPLFPLATFFGTLLLLARAFIPRANAESGDRALLWAALAGVATGLHFYISIFYWTHLVVGIVLLTLLSGNRRKWALFSIGVATALLTVLPYVAAVLHLREFPGYEVFAWRNGIFLKDRALYLLPHKALWLFILLSLPLFRRADEKIRFLGAFVLAGLGCYFSSLVTGISLQNFHWHYTLAPLLFISAALSLMRLLPARRGVRVRALAVPVLLLAVIASPVMAIQRAVTYPADKLWARITGSEQAYHEAWAWLRKHAAPESVILANDLISDFIPSRTGLRVWVSPHLVAEIMRYEDILERYEFLWLLEGKNSESLKAALFPAEPATIAQWIHGIDRETLGRLRQRNFPPLILEINREIAIRLSKNFPNEERILSAARARKVDWLVRGPAESELGPRPEKYFRLEAAGVFNGVRVDRVLGWR